MTAPRPGRPSIGEHRNALGRRGEDLVADWYENRGFRVIARNWRCRDGEIDIIAADGRVLVFCEVKTRSSSTFGAPYEAVTHRKQARIRRLALLFLAASERPRSDEIRFDVASVTGNDVDVIEAAF